MAESPSSVPGAALVGLTLCIDFVVGTPGMPICLPRGALCAPGVPDTMGASAAAAAGTTGWTPGGLWDFCERAGPTPLSGLPRRGRGPLGVPEVPGVPGTFGVPICLLCVLGGTGELGTIGVSPIPPVVLCGIRTVLLLMTLVGLTWCIDFVVGTPGMPICLPRGALCAPGVPDTMGASVAAAPPGTAGWTPGGLCDPCERAGPTPLSGLPRRGRGPL